MNTNDVYNRLKTVEQLITVSFILEMLLICILAWMLGGK